MITLSALLYSQVFARGGQAFDPVRNSINVFPSEISAVNWSNVGAAVSQDLGRYALFQNFNGHNSAYIDFESNNAVHETVSIPETVPTNETSSSEQTLEQNFDTPTTSPTEEDVPAEVVPEVAPPTPDVLDEVIQDEQNTTTVETTPEPTDVPVEQTEEEPFIVSFFKRVTDSFSFTQAATTVTTTSEAVVVESLQESPQPEEEVIVPVTTVAGTSSEQTDETTEKATSTPEEPQVETENVTEDTTVQEPVEVPEVQGDEPDEVAVTETAPHSVATLTFADFGVPVLERGEFIDNLQLRLSLAGQFNGEASTTLPTLSFEYSFGSFKGEAGDILLEEEFSNAINGGYYLIPLPSITDPKLLADLSVTVTFDGDPEKLKALFIDAAWLEVETVIYDSNQLKKRVAVSEMWKHLRQLSSFDFLSDTLDFTRDEAPRFSLRYHSQRNVLVQVFRSLFSDEFAQVKNVSFRRTGGGDVNVNPDVSITEDGLINIILSDEDKANLMPGVYEVEVEVDEGGVITTDSFEFQWGLLSINTNQTEYSDDEEVFISMAALLSDGSTLCNARLNLYVTDPTGLITYVPVVESGKCEGNNVVDVPDYSALYTTDAFGEYEMYLERVNDVGEVLTHITETFRVVPNQEIVIERNGPTRIYPPAPYIVDLSVHALNRSFNGQLIERVPSTFKIFNTDAEINEYEKYTELVWDMSMFSGTTESVSYEFDAPDISPFLFNLGPARLVTEEEVLVTETVQVPVAQTASSTGTSTDQAQFETSTVETVSTEESVIFEEHRQWQIASDAVQPNLPNFADTPAFESFVATTTTPTLGGFAATDPDGDDVQYELQIDDDYFFGSPATTTLSENYPNDAGWSASTFSSGATTTYTIQPSDALTNGQTYWYRVRAKDPSDTDSWGQYSLPRSITIDTASPAGAWQQTFGYQFEAGTLTGLATTSDDVEVGTDTTLPVVQAGWTTDTASTGNTLTLDLPSGVEVDDLLLVIVGNDAQNAGAQWSGATLAAAGFTMINEAGDNTSDAHVVAFYKVADGTEASTLNVTAASTQDYWGFYIRVTGVDPDNPLHVTGADYNGSAASHAVPAVSASVINTLAFYVLAGDGGDTAPFSVSGTGWSESDEIQAGTGGTQAAGTWGTRSMSGISGSTGNATVSLNTNDGGAAFQFALTPAPVTSGTIMSPEIDFDWVPNQDSWGDVTWNVTQPAGSTALLRLYYSDVTACDTIIPDIDFAGNSTGFAATSSNMYIDTLSTSAYDRICLQMTLDTGSATTSPTLDDWRVRWELPNQAPGAPTFIEVPAFDNLLATATPALGGFYATDFESDDVEYEFELDDNPDFGSPILTKSSSNYPTDAGWSSDTFPSGGSTAPWFDTDWPYRIPITIDASLVDAPLTDFPVYVDLATLGSQFFSDVTASGGDIRVTASDGVTEVPREVFGVSTGSEIGELYFEADAISDTSNTVFYIYYGNSGASDYASSDPYGSESVWANNYEVVYHMEADPSDGAPQYIDSTGNSSGTAVNMEGADQFTGIAGFASDVDGADESIQTNSSQTLLNSTWSIWLDADGTQGACDGAMFSRGTGVNGMNVGACGDTSRIGYHWENLGATSWNWATGPVYPTNQWFMATLRIEPTQATAFVHAPSGVSSGSNVVSHTTSTIDNLDFGWDSFGTARSFDGTLDEVRLSSVARADEWLSAEYYNIASTTDFYATSTRQTPDDSSEVVTYTIQPADALSDGTYYWRIRARDPLGSNTWSSYSQSWSVTVDSSIENLAWHQTFGEQFERGTLSSTATTTDGVVINFSYVPGNATTSDSFEGVTDNSTNFASTNLWKQASISSDDGDWEAETGDTASDPTGATDGSDGGTYIYTETSDGGECDGTTGDQFVCVIEADIEDGTLEGIRFDYHMFGTDIGTLNLDVYNGSSWTNVWTQSGEQSANGGDWLDSGYLDLSAYKQTTTALRFHAVGTGSATGYLGDIGLDNIRVATSSVSNGTIMSPEIDFDWVEGEADWGTVSWDVTEPGNSDSVLRLYYTNVTACDTIIPDGTLPGNSTGFDISDSGMFINSLSTSTYNRICLEMTLDYGSTTTSPTLNDWTVTWVIPNQTPSTPALAATPAFDNMKSTSTTPSLGGFVSTDYENEQLEYQIIIDNDYDLLSPVITKQSSDYPTDAGWSSAIFTSGATTTYTIQAGDALTEGQTYWWAVRARDPSGTNIWSATSTRRSITINSVIAIPEWYQTTGKQFESASFSNVGTSSDALVLLALGGDTSTTTDSFEGVGNGSANFASTNLWKQAAVTSDTGDWWGTTGGTPSGGTGPDNATDGSVAIYTEASNNQTCDNQGEATDCAIEADIVDGTLQGIHFDYHMFGANLGTLYLDVYNGSSWSTVWSVAGQQSANETDWQDSGYLDLSAYRDTTTLLRFYAVGDGGGFSGDFALDNIRVATSTTGALGTAMSEEVDFASVPNQNTWGEAQWNTIEPSGTDVLVRLYYTNATACDTIIPDGALPGNSTGFDATNSPIDISGLSTTTYSQICMQATLDQGTGGTSPSLTDWGIRWITTPYFTQSNFWWFDNTNSVTPTDPWPAGATDVAENESIDSDNSVLGGDELRLRIALTASNTTAVAGSTAFKLQYAANDVCADVVTWSDVAPIGSSTAIWRGYNNSSPSDGATLPSAILTGTDVLQTYEEENNTLAIPNTIDVDENAEWDWVIDNNGAAGGTNYCFRMAYSDGTRLKAYTDYPSLVTNSSPGAAALYTPFDNEKLASGSLVFEFAADDPEGELLDYQIQISTSPTFASTIVNTNSVSNLTDFVNTESPADKSPFNDAQRMRYNIPSAPGSGTYWWRVRAKDTTGSNSYGDWSDAQSFTIEAVSISTWFQTTEEQFDTDTLVGTDAIADDDWVELLSGSTTGTVHSTAINFSDATTGNAWGQFTANQTGSPGDIVYHFEYFNGSSWNTIPNSALPNNVTGFSTTTVDLLNLDNATYDIIRIRANFESGSPTLLDWTIEWGERVSVPTLVTPFDNEKFGTTSPTFTFYTTDPQDEELEYEISWSTDATFQSGTTTRNSTSSPGFLNIISGGDTESPYISGDTISYTIQSGEALTASTTYWWRVRAKDPDGSDSFSFWSEPWSFTTATSGELIEVSTWYQTTQDQFLKGILLGATTSGNAVTVVPSASTVSLIGSWASPEEDDSINYTAPAGTNRANVVIVENESGGAAFTSMTGCTGNMVRIDAGVGGNNSIAAFYEVIGTSASVTNCTFTGTASAEANIIITAATFENVLQVEGADDASGPTLAIYNSTNGGANAAPPGSVTLTGTPATPEGGLVVYGFNINNNTATADEPAGFTEDVDYQGGSSYIATGRRNTTAESNSVTVDVDGTAGNRWNAVAFALNPSSGSEASGIVISPSLDFDDGDGPAWGELYWNDAEPSASDALYQLQYLNGIGEWTLISNAALSGNETGFDTPPINLESLNTGTYNELRVVGNLTCDGSNCPTLQDWTVEWSKGFTVSGTALEYDGVSSTTAGTVAIAVNDEIQLNKTGTILSNGTWSIDDVTLFAGDVITVFVNTSGDATSADEAVAVTVYDGSPDVTGMRLQKRHLTIGSDDNATVSNTNLSLYNASNDEDIFYDVSSNDLDMCADTACSDAGIVILANNTYAPGTGADTITHDFENYGTYTAGANTMRVGGSWTNAGAFTSTNSTIRFTATTSTESVDSTGASTAGFNNVIFGETSGAATWQLASDLDVNNDLTISYGTLDQNGGNDITLGRHLNIGLAGSYAKGTATTTFDGTVLGVITDASSPKQDLGIVVIDGTTKAVELGSNIALTNLTIGSDDSLSATGNHYDITVYGNWTNNNTFTASQGEVIFAGTAGGNVIDAGSNAFYDLTFNGVGGDWSFTESTLSVNNNFSIATGTVTLTTATTTIGGSFSNTGLFAHNNNTVLFTSSGAETIATNGDAFNNAFYNLTFNGGGSWTFTDTNASSSNDVLVTSGTVTFPSGVFAIGGSLLDTGGAFVGNSGTVAMYSSQPEDIQAGGSTLSSLHIQGAGSFTFLDTNATIADDLTVSAGTVVLPSGTLSIGGSVANTATITANGGEILFNSDDNGETIDFGASSMYDLTFNGVGGGWTITSHATATNDVTLTDFADFTLASGQRLSVGAQFTNSVGGASTTWSGSTLALVSGAYSINTKTDAGDAYGTLSVAPNTDIQMWNSTSSLYAVDSSGSLYSQDHNAVDGDLYIWGSYERTSGTEYWSYATDFDGVSLSGGSERQVDVQFASGAGATFATATLQILGDSTASTTITNQGNGTYTVTASNSTVNARYYEFADLGGAGFSLLDGSTVTSLRDGSYTVSSNGGSALTIASTTIDANPAKQIFNVSFATATAISAFNVSQIGGTSTSYWWFRESSGNLGGEAYDNDTGNPGTIRWDDSALQFDISGTVYTDDGASPLVGGTCDDGGTNPIRVVVENGGTFDGYCDSSDGTFTVSDVAVVGDPTITVFLNDANGGEKAVTVTRTPTADITDLDLYENRVIVRHEDVEALTITNMAHYDASNDSDVPFTISSGELSVQAGYELHVWDGSTFTPGGGVVLNANASGDAFDGSLHIGNNATFTGSGTTTYTVGGSVTLDNNATFVPASTTLVMNATTTGKTITTSATGTLAVYNLTFAGTSGGWNINGDIVASSDIQVATGTVTGTGDITLTDGSLYGNGILSLGGGNVTLEDTNTFGGTSAWTVNNLTLGNGIVSGTTTRANTATTTVAGVLTIATGHFLDTGASYWDLSGSGTVFVENGTFLEDTSTVTYSGSGATNILSTDYYNLVFSALGGAPTYTATGLGIQAFGNVQVGGASATTVTFDTNDTAFNVDGNFTITANGTFIASNSGSFTIAGNYDNNGTFTGSGGTVTFDGSGVATIAAGNSSFATAQITGTGDYTVSEHATATTAFTLSANPSAFTLASGQTLAVGGTFTNALGGVATDWSGSQLYLYGGGNYAINASTTADSYEALTVGPATQIRTWNSDAVTPSVASNASLYAMDHANVTGDLYIWGVYTKTSGTDYWSYATDFDGGTLGSPRKVDVYFASGASALYTGGGLQVVGVGSASTTVQNQGSGSYSLRIGGTATANMTYYEIRDIDASGLTFSGTPTIGTLSRGDILVTQASGNAITVGGTVINQNPAKTFVGNIFATSSAISAFNVQATGTTVSSWRFTNYTGNLGGEAYDIDPDGDPGYVVWDDSAASITVSGRVYDTTEGPGISGVCDGSTANITLVVEGTPFGSTSCNGGTGLYSFSGVSFSPDESLIVYIDGETEYAAAVTVDMGSNINNMDLYENRVIVRHEGTDPITIADLNDYDSGDSSGEVPFTANASSVSLPANTKLIVWSGKTFEPGGDVIVAGGGGGSAYDGTVELFTNASFVANDDEEHVVGGSLILDSGASYDAAQSTTTFTTTGASRTIDTNDDALYNVVFDGAGSWNITNTTLDANNVLISNGSVTLPSGTSTISGFFNNVGGSFTHNGSRMDFTGDTGPYTVAFGGSDVAPLTFTGGGTWNMTDTNATSTGAFTIVSGTVSLPSGTLTLGDSFRNVAGSVTHNTSEIIIATSTTATLLANGSDLYAVTFRGGGTFTMEDQNMALLDSLTIASGHVILVGGTATSTLSIGGSFDASGGTFDNATSTILFNSADTGETIDPGVSDFYNVVFGSASGGWTIVSDATTTNMFALTSASSFTLQSGARLYVGGTFDNAVGGAQTTWTGSTLVLDLGITYEINDKLTGGDIYETVVIGADSDISAWNSQATTLTVASDSSFYSQDHAGSDGALNIYGDYHISTTTEYWSYATDFDGVPGANRAVTVSFASNATTTVDGGTLNIVGTLGNETTITNQGAGTFSLQTTGGTFNAQYYDISNLNATGLNLTGTTLVTSLNYGSYTLAVNGGTLITIASSTLNANAAKILTGLDFSTTTAITGENVTLVGTTSAAWTFVSHTGNLDGEAYDVDGGTLCGSLRWDDSVCQLTEQTAYRWRLDDGGEGVPDSEWYSQNWDKRKRINITNEDATEYTDVAVELPIVYDSDMQGDFDDLRFTASDGTTELSYFLETYSGSSNAVAWVALPTLPASAVTEVYMYYGNATATDASVGTSTFSLFEDFEDDDITNYSGQLSLFDTDITQVYERTYALDNDGNEEQQAGSGGIYRTDITAATGTKIRYFQYVDTVDGVGDEPCMLFGVQSAGNNFGVCLEQFGTPRISLAEDVLYNDLTAGSIIASTTVSYETGWYEVEIAWEADNDMVVSLYKDDSLVASITGNSSAYETGGIGFTYWYHFGAWDLITARPLMTTEPTVTFGSEQVPGGATWVAAKNTLYSGATINTPARLRMLFENSGLDVTGQTFRLDYAPKGSALSCEAVEASDYAAVPPQASCGSSPICMQTSSNFSNNDATTDLLGVEDKTFVSGEMLESPSNKTTPLDIDTNEYTEIEYALVPTINVADESYCFRLTDDGTHYDSYSNVAELQFRFDPSVTLVTLNGGADIALLPGATTTIVATGTVTDLNGYTDLDSATTTFYRSGVGVLCGVDNNNCYIASGPQCSFYDCSGNTCSITCSADFYFHADATDVAPYEGEEWLASIEVSDQAGGIDIGTVGSGVEVTSLRALDVVTGINYGALAAATTTGAYNASTTVQNLGNVAIDINLEGTDLTDGGSSAIPAFTQLFATSTFNYTSCMYCTKLSSTSTVSGYEVDLSKPTDVAPPVEDVIYWGIRIPFGVSSNPHSGINTFYAVSD